MEEATSQGKWLWQTCDKQLLREKIKAVKQQDTVTTPEGLDRTLKQICREQRRKKGGAGKRKTAYWWTPEIADARRVANKLRRILVRSRGRMTAVAEVDAIREKYK